MRYSINILHKVKKIFAQETENLQIEEPAVETQINNGFILGSGRSTTEIKRAFKALSALVIPQVTPRNTFYNVIKSISSNPPFETKIVNRKKITCFVFNGVCYEIPQSSGSFKIDLIQETNIFNNSWGEGYPFNANDVKNFDKFLSDNKIVSGLDYDNFCKQKVYVNIGSKLYYLFPRVASVNETALKEILRSKLSVKTKEQRYGGEILTKQVLTTYLQDNDYVQYYNIIDSTDHTFARIEDFVVSEKGQEVLDLYSNINFTDLKEIITKHYFFDDPIKEHLVYSYCMFTNPYYNSLKSIQKESLRKDEFYDKVAELYTGLDKAEAFKKIRVSVDNLIQDLTFVSERKRGNFKKYYHLLDAIAVIKFFYFRDRNSTISDKIDLSKMKESSFDSNLLEKKADFLLMPKREYHQTLPVILVEFDGEQHFKPKFGRNFVRIKMYDAIKNNFFMNTPGYGIIRVPFTLVKDSPTKDYRPDIMNFIKPELDKMIKEHLSAIQKAAKKVFNSMKFALNKKKY